MKEELISMKSKIFLISFFSTASLITLALPAHAQMEPESSVRPAPIAMVYDGPGSCEEGCTKAAEQVAIMAGYQVRLIKPDDITEHTTNDEINEFFKGSHVWIQPGGISNEAYLSMTEKLKETLVNFIGGGGGYVAKVLRSETKFTGYAQMRLDTSQLPKPLQVNALTNSDWSLESERFSWPIQPNEAKSEPPQ